MGDKFAAAHSKAKRGFLIGAADDVKLRTLREAKDPTHLNNIGKSFRVIGVDVREEDGVELRGLDSDLRKSHERSAPGIKLRQHRPAVVGIVTVPHERSGPGQVVVGRRPACTGQCDDHARRGLRTCRSDARCYE
jgi:hypothetical protein